MFVNTMIQLLLYFIGLVISATDEHGMNNKIFLGIYHLILDSFGMRLPFLIVHELELWLWVTSLYATHSFLTIMLNSVAQLV